MNLSESGHDIQENKVNNDTVMVYVAESILDSSLTRSLLFESL